MVRDTKTERGRGKKKERRDIKTERVGRRRRKDREKLKKRKCASHQLAITMNIIIIMKIMMLNMINDGDNDV